MGNTFKDTEGREWSPRITLHALEGFARETGLNLNQLMDIQAVKLAHLAAAVWHMVAAEAKSRKGGPVTREDFTAAVGLKQAMDAIEIVMGEVEDQFPEAAKDLKDEGGKIRASLGGDAEDPLPETEETETETSPSSNASAN